MDAMPHPRWPYLHRQVTRHRKTTWYARIGKGRRVRLRSEFGSPQFSAEYQAAIARLSEPAPKEDSASTGSLAWLVQRYREVGAWTNLSLATRRQRENIFRQVL